MTPAHEALERVASSAESNAARSSAPGTMRQHESDITIVRKSLLTDMEAAELSGIIANYRGRYGSDPSLEALSSKVNAIAGFLE